MKIISTVTLFLLLSFSALPATVKIMPLGDSITFDWHYSDSRNDTQRHGYRNHLWYKLQAAYYDVDFVGTQHAGSAVSPSFDIDNEGHKGYTTYQIGELVYSKLQATAPDIILLHIGTNDSMYHSAEMAVYHLGEILDKIDNYEKYYHKHVTVILARIIPLPKAGNWVNSFNSSLDSMVANRISNGDDIIKVNMNVINSLIDGIHPTDSGYQQMAGIWFNALKVAVIPPAPTNIIASALKPYSAILSWKDNSNTEDGFKIYRGTVLIATVGKNTTSYTLNNLESRQTYTYTIVAYSQNGNAKGQNITFTTKDDYAWIIPINHMILN